MDSSFSTLPPGTPFVGSEQLLRFISDSIPALISYLTPDGRYKFCNRTYIDWFGLPAESLIGRRVEEIVGEQMWKASEPRFRQALSGQSVQYEVEAKYKHGGRRWVHVSYTPHRLENGQIGGVVAMVSDITQRKMVEEEARTSEERVRLALGLADGITWDFDPATGEVQWSDGFSRLVGAAGKPDTIETWQSRLNPEGRDQWRDEWQRAQKENDRFFLEYQVRKDDGAWIWVRTAARFFRNAQGQALRVIGVIFDISAAKESSAKLEALVRERTASLSTKIAELEAFSYSLSHDLRAPLRSMYGFAQVLLAEKAPALDEEARDFLRRIERGAQRLDLLIRDVLKYSQVSRDTFELSPVDLNVLIDDALATLGSSPATIQVDRPLPLVLGHEALLMQVFLNLLDNAFKFVRSGEVPSIRIHAEIHGKRARLWVEDEGLGIAARDRERIFEIFTRLNPDNTFAGTGIGLSIVRKAAERLGGSAGVEAGHIRGSRFWVDLALSQ